MAGEIFSLEGRTVLVTGASSGLGRFFSSALARAGAKVAVAARRVDHLKTIAEEIAADGGSAFPIEMDVTDASSVVAAFDQAQDALGNITVLINNAGIAETKPALDWQEKDWDAILDTNLKGAWTVAQEAARRMAKAETGGTIVNVASILGFRVAKELLPYAVSKAGLVQMTKAMALELARYGVRVNALAPGYVETDLNRDFLLSGAGEEIKKRIPQRRFGHGKDLEGALLLLASDASAYMTGAVIPVDGGHLVSSL
jgi:NAD(P)-dependent dehydrogenase (short-subunit alcohol dehydrogenase family)